MNILRAFGSFRVGRGLAAFFLLGLVSPAYSQPARPGTGTIEGRVFDSGRGEFLERARIVVDGTTIETFTDSSGQYRLSNVPAGEIKVRVFFTGLLPQTTSVAVGAGNTVQHDVTLTASAAPRPASASEPTVRMDQFVVGASKEMDGAAIAINTQRFARNIMSVVAADEFGTVVDGTPGEVMKFLPGITMDYSAGEARTVSINGAPSANVPITVGGFDLASAASNGTSRVTNLDQFSVNSIARIEVMHSPTPESTGSALAGSVNMVPRSAFERSRPSYSGSVFWMMKDGERSLKKTAGPLDGRKSYKITPGYNFSVIMPVNKIFGFTLSGNYADQYSYEDVATMTWRGVGSATTAPAANGTPGALPDTTPDKPYLSDFAVRDSTRDNRTYSIGTTADYKVSRNDTLSFSFQYTFIGVLHDNRTFSFFVNRVNPGDWGPTFTRGAPGSGTTPGGFGEVRVQGSAQDWLGTTVSPSVIWRHNGPLWRAEAGMGLSRASLHVRSIDKGFFHASQARRTNVRVSFADIFYLRPNTISVTDDRTGAPVNPYDLGNYSLASADDNPRDSVDLKRSAFANMRRDFSVREIPLSLKGGLDIKSAARDLRGTTTNYSFVGRDRTASTNGVGDDNAAEVLDTVFQNRPGRFGLPTLPWLDNFKYFELYKAHPEYFTIDQNAFYRSGVTNSKWAEEIISSAYLRADVAFFNRRLQFVGGLRGEQANVKGHGPLTDPTRAFRRDASGKVVYQRDANGNTVVNAQGIPQAELLAPTNAGLPYSQLTFIERGQRTQKEYLRLFPNLNASFNVRENLIARGAYYQSVGRPDFNEYAGGLTLPDLQRAPDPSTNRIAVNNAGIKAWQAETYKVRIEYYFEKVGQLSIGGFRRDFKNFFGNIVFNATPEFLDLYGLDPAIYDTFDVSTKYNIPGTVRMSGMELDYKQALTFLPHWARGVQVFANASTLRATGAATSNLSGFIPRTTNWGFSVTRPKFLVRANWNYRAAARQGLVGAGRSIDPSTYNWGAKRLYIDLTGEYTLVKRFTAFANLRNIGDAPQDNKIYGPNTPDYAKFRQRVSYGSAWTFGLRGSF
jgi:TonB-dependent receptor